MVSTPSTNQQSELRDRSARAAAVVGDGAILFLSSVKEASDSFPPLKSAAAGILILVDIISVRN
jgi:hypothetical protein